MNAFKGFVGNADTTERLSVMLSSGRVPHAFIFEGDKGTGRKTLANMLARGLACTGKDKPCGVCESCRITENPDIVTVLPEKSAITVDKIRAIRDEAYILPNQSEKRVFIIPDANLMNEQAQNALLKVFEEPPKSVAFILTCEYSGQLLSTVISRAAVFKLSAPDVKTAVEYIENNYPDYDNVAVTDAVRSSSGNIGAALSVLSGGDKTDLTARGILAVMGDKSELSLLKALLVIEKDRPFAKAVLLKMNELVCDALAYKSGAKMPLPEDDVRVSLADKFTGEHLLGISSALLSAKGDCDSNCNGALMITNLCACIRTQIDL